MNIYSFNWIKLQEGLRNNAELFTRIYPGAEFLHAFSVGSTDYVMCIVEVVADVSVNFVDVRHGGILLIGFGPLYSFHGNNIDN